MAETGDTTIVGSDSHFKGELTFERTAKINGKFDGNITGKGELQVSENATCKADVEAAGVEVNGLVEGNLNAKDTVKLNGSGVVRGDITAAKMVMSEGASFHGMCAVGSDSGRPSASSSGGSSSAGGQPGQAQGGQPPKK